MGDLVITDYALSKEIFRELIAHLELDWSLARDDDARFHVAEFANLLIFLYLIGLRGEEGMKVEAAGFLQHLDAGYAHEEFPHVIVPLLGRLKGETGERHHLLPMARTTQSGLQAGLWADRLGMLLVGRGWTNGWIYRDRNGGQAKIGDYDSQFIDRLKRVQMEKPNLFDPKMDIGDAYGLRRSLRRGSTSEATNAKVRQPVIELNNRWRKFDESKGKRPSMSMVAHYTEVKLMLPTLFEYSHSF